MIIMSMNKNIPTYLKVEDLEKTFLDPDYVRFDFVKNVYSEKSDCDAYVSSVIAYNKKVISKNKEKLIYLVDIINKILVHNSILLSSSILNTNNNNENTSYIVDDKIYNENYSTGLVLHRNMSSEKIAANLVKDLSIVRDLKLYKHLQGRDEKYESIVNSHLNTYYKRYYEENKNKKIFYISDLFDTGKSLDNSQINLVNEINSILGKYKTKFNPFLKGIDNIKDLLSFDIGVKDSFMNLSKINPLVWIGLMKEPDVKDDVLAILTSEDYKWSSEIRLWYGDFLYKTEAFEYEISVDNKSFEEFMIDNIESVAILDAITHGALFSISASTTNFPGRLLVELAKANKEFRKNHVIKYKSEMSEMATKKINIFNEIDEDKILSKNSNNSRDLLKELLTKREHTNKVFVIQNLVDIVFYKKNDLMDYNCLETLEIIEDLTNSLNLNIKIVSNEYYDINNKYHKEFKIQGFNNETDEIKNLFIDLIITSVYINSMSSKVNPSESENINDMFLMANNIKAPNEDKVRYLFNLLRGEKIKTMLSDDNIKLSEKRKKI